MMYHGDPLEDFARYDAECAAAEEKRPKCKCCQNAIWDKEAIYYDGDWYCEDCRDEFCKQFMERIEEDE